MVAYSALRTVTHAPAILARSDAGETPAAIAAALGVPVGSVYSILRAERPDRARAS